MADNRRDLFAPLYLAILALVLGFVCAPSLPAAESPKPAARQEKPHSTDSKSTPVTVTDSGELKERVRTLEDRERQTYAFVLEGQRKTMDWWFSYLAIVTAIIGIGGVFLPLFLGMKDREELEQLRQDFREQLDHVKQRSLEIDHHVDRGKAAADALENHLKQLADATISPNGIPAQQPQQEAVREAAKQIENNEAASLADRLRAKAISHQLRRDYAGAKPYWQTLIAELPQDAQAQFGLGVCLHEEGNLRQAGEQYAKALAIKHDMHDAANNWGNALAAEARGLAPTNLPAARALWRQAGERYAQALAIKPDMQGPAYNWGNALADEASALAQTDLTAARELWRQSGKQYAQALANKPAEYWIANNWGNALKAEASALASTDLTAACELWRQAGKRYAQALAIEPEWLEAAMNWDCALQTVSMLDPLIAEKCLLEAEELKPGIASYYLASAASERRDVSACLDWLNNARKYHQLSNAAHLREDKNFDPVRDTPEFVAWWVEVFGSDEPLLAT